MQVQIETLEELFADRHFAPASVQRSFLWSEREVGSLLSDLTAAFNESEACEATRERGEATYFLGSIVLSPAGSNQFNVFDGLQRLTTLTVLHAVLVNLLRDAGVEDEPTFRTVDENEAPRLTLAQGAGGLDEICRPGEALRVRRTGDKADERSRVFRTARAMVRWFDGWTAQSLLGFASFVARDVVVCVYQVSDEHLARQVFVTTNNRGLPLEEVDVLRSQIGSIAHRDDVASQAVEKWTALERSFQTGDEFEGFLRAIDFIERKSLPAPEGLPALGDHLVHHLDDNSVLPWLEEASERAQAWKTLRAIAEKPWKHGEAGLATLRLSAIGRETYFPIILLWVQSMRAAPSHRQASKLFAKRLDRLSQFALIELLRGAGGPALFRKLVSAISDVRADRSPFSRALSNDPKLVTDSELVSASQRLDETALEGALKWLAAPRLMRHQGNLLQLRAVRILPRAWSGNDQWASIDRQDPGTALSSDKLGNWVLVPENAVDALTNAGSYQVWKKLVRSIQSKSWGIEEILKAKQWTLTEIAIRTAELQSALLNAVRSDAASEPTASEIERAT